MSRLEFYARPLVAFDPRNKDHRRWYYEFLEYKGWGRCPVRFICTEDHGSDLTVMIRNALVEYYVNKEFKPKATSKLGTIVRKLAAQKTPKTVDKRTKR
jgi:hypothetical protein